MPNIFTDGGGVGEKELPVNSKTTKHPMIQKKAVSETPNHSNSNSNTYNYKHIEYQRGVKQTKISTLQERGTRTPI